MEDFATIENVGDAWRPLNSAEKNRGEHWLEVASRRIRRRWPDVDARIVLPTEDPRHLDEKDVRDVVIALVIEVLGGPPVPNAVAYSAGSGTESRSVTLGSASPADPALFTSWMVAVFEGMPDTVAQPRWSFPTRRETFGEWRDT